MDAPLLASGRDADVFDVGDGRVLRRYRDGFDATPEAELMAYVARYGYPVPAVHDVSGPDLVMDRLTGPTMAGALMDGSTGLSAAATVLAALLDRLHAVPPRADGGDPVVHLDLHPENVVMTPSGPVVIDWSTATDGPADLDVAVSALILAEVAAAPSDPRGPLVLAFLSELLRRVQGDPVRLLDAAVARRRVNPTLSEEEKARLDDAAALVVVSRR